MKQTVYLNPGDKKQATFVVKLLDSGIYEVTFNELETSFVAKQTPFVSIISPVGGEQWLRGQTYDIQWDAHDVDKVEVTYRQWISLPPDASTISRPITGQWEFLPPTPGLYSWTIPADVEPGTYTIVVEGYKDGSLVSRAESSFFDILGADKYTAGIYYIYPEEYKGSDDWYNWKHNWEEWCKHEVGYHRDLLINYLKEHGISEASMPIEFVEKQGLPAMSDVPSWVRNESQDAPRYDDVDIRVVTNEDALIGTARAWPTRHTILVRAYSFWRSREGMEGNTQFPIDQTFAHEIGHLYGLDHCHESPCPMAQVQLWYHEWANMGKKHWFCSRHKAELLYRWQAGMLGYWPHRYLVKDVSI